MAPAVLAGSGHDRFIFSCAKDESVGAFTKRFGLSADPGEADSSGATAIEWAAFAGHAGMVSRLISLGYPADVSDRGGLTPLLGAAGCCDSESVVHILLTQGGLTSEAINRATT